MPENAGLKLFIWKVNVIERYDLTKMVNLPFEGFLESLLVSGFSPYTHVAVLIKWLVSMHVNLCVCCLCLGHSSWLHFIGISERGTDVCDEFIADRFPVARRQGSNFGINGRGADGGLTVPSACTQLAPGDGRASDAL